MGRRFFVRKLIFKKVFSYTLDKEIRVDDLCLDVARAGSPVQMVKCHHQKGNQLWEFNERVSLEAFFQY